MPLLYSQGLVTLPEFEIVVPGSEVPDWFIYRSEGSSIRISQPLLTCRGLAFCAVLSVHDLKDIWMKLDCDAQVTINPAHAVSKTPLDTKRTRILSMTFPLNSLAGKDHLWLFYISRSCLTDNDLLEVSFGDKTDKGVTAKVKTCGLHPVYDSDIEEFIKASSSLSSNTSPEVLAPDRLAVTSTVIKRSPDYSPDQQPYPKRLK
ncbi:hypothetical protein Pint_07119 [Pistacia integerrima]|uniref:Uncharacterized protein n=1 Tax=Pistacia integerrima TaxID=434235 RepID=A0ACC0XT94_9ROSI|nr:hypothetical protein Pint_07119 [Pistacia integerrima]